MIDINKNSNYFLQVKLLLTVLPFIMKDQRFALKGGTAINLFYRDFPRLSIDIDLTYIDIEPRESTLKNISQIFTDIKDELQKKMPLLKVDLKMSADNNIKQIVINENKLSVKVEINNILRGHLYECEERDLCDTAQNLFAKFLSIKCLSIEDLYAGKLVAALDRQHPRDLYDAKLLIDNEGISEKLKDAFIVYLLSSNRPISELLNPNLLDISDLYDRELKGMAIKDDISYDDLIMTRKTLISNIQKLLNNDNDKEFLLSFKKGAPRWELFSKPDISIMPALNWKLANIKRLDKDKHRKLIQNLESLLCSF